MIFLAERRPLKGRAEFQRLNLILVKLREGNAELEKAITNLQMSTRQMQEPSRSELGKRLTGLEDTYNRVEEMIGLVREEILNITNPFE